MSDLVVDFRCGKPAGKFTCHLDKGHDDSPESMFPCRADPLVVLSDELDAARYENLNLKALLDAEKQNGAAIQNQSKLLDDTYRAEKERTFKLTEKLVEVILNELQRGTTHAFFHGLYERAYQRKVADEKEDIKDLFDLQDRCDAWEVRASDAELAMREALHEIVKRIETIREQANHGCQQCWDVTTTAEQTLMVLKGFEVVLNTRIKKQK